MLNLKY